MTAEEIKRSVADGVRVFWSTTSYEVIMDHLGRYLIQHSAGSCIGLTWADGVTLNGKECDFFTKKNGGAN